MSSARLTQMQRGEKALETAADGERMPCGGNLSTDFSATFTHNRGAAAEVSKAPY